MGVRNGYQLSIRDYAQNINEIQNHRSAELEPHMCRLRAEDKPTLTRPKTHRITTFLNICSTLPDIQVQLCLSVIPNAPSTPLAPNP